MYVMSFVRDKIGHKDTLLLRESRGSDMVMKEACVELTIVDAEHSLSF